MRGKHLAGFTLLEMLVAIAIFALVAIMAHGGLRSVLQNRAHVEQQGERLQALQMALLLVGRDLGQASGRGIRDEFGDRQPALRSASHGPILLEFTQGGWRNPAGQARSVMQRVAYALDEQTLQRWSWSVLDRAQDSEPYRAVLLEGVEEVRLRFLDAGREWHDSWPPMLDDGSEGPALPLAVELELELSGVGRIRRLWTLPDNPHGLEAVAPPSAPSAESEPDQ